MSRISSRRTLTAFSDDDMLSTFINAPSVHRRSPLPDLRADELPLRNASLGSRPKAPQLMGLVEAEEPAEPPVPISKVAPLVPQLDDPEVKPRLAKEKTRSRVWGVLTGKRNSKFKAGVPQCVGAAGDGSSPPSQSNGRVSVSQPVGRSSVSQPSRPSTRPRPPTLHITHPSQKLSIPPVPTRRLVADADSPFVSRKRAPTPAQDVVLDATSVPASRRTPSAATSRKSVPKRKSLAGLFGSSFQKSMDKLRSNSPVPPMPEPPSTPPRISNSLMDDDTSPDTRAFYSRQGTYSGFNLHGNLLHPDGEHRVSSHF